MALQRFVLPTVLKADDVVGSERLVDRHRRLMLLGLRRRLCNIPEGLVNARDQLWYLRRLNVVLGNVSRHDLGADADQVGCCSSCIGSLPHRPEAVVTKSPTVLLVAQDVSAHAPLPPEASSGVDRQSSACPCDEAR